MPRKPECRFTLRRVGAVEDSELVIGLVTPVGTNTTELADKVKGFLSSCAYKAVVIKLSDLMPMDEPPPVGECEDQRVQRLITAGNEFCKVNQDPAALALLAVKEILSTRIALLRQDGNTQPAAKIVAGRPRTAYILHSLKRPAEVKLLREVYGGQFMLIGSQGTADQRKEILLQRNLSAASEHDRKAIVEVLMQRDADDHDPFGQNVNDTYPQADFFLRNNDDVDRVVGLLFGEPIPPEIGEYAMYVARASAARSLAASRKVGAAIVMGDAVVATGYNDVPHGLTPDVLQRIDTSEQFKQDNLRDTLTRLKDSGMLREGLATIGDEEVAKAAAALKGGELMSVIEYQRAVHAEARAIDDATVRGITTIGGTLYVTTYPCHLCYKHALSARLGRIEYIEPYSKSRAVRMFDEAADSLVPFAGVAPQRYMQTFDDRAPFMSDSSGIFTEVDRRVAHPLLSDVREDAARAQREWSAVNELNEEYQ